MNRKNLNDARKYEKEVGDRIPSELRPVFHLTPKVGWMNDPNGFSLHNGEYHLFYQYYPYEKKWGPMHWGHAVSKDLLEWRHLPAALAPDTLPDQDGCFSGSAIDLEDGRQLLMYTGVIQKIRRPKAYFTQEQCLAVEDEFGNFHKYVGNPVIKMTDIPADTNLYDFRDPKIWKEKDGTYGCVIGNNTKDGWGRVLYFTSKDAFSWKFVSVLAVNDGTLGKMWECPDYFKLDGKDVILCSPQDMVENDKYFCGNNTLCLIGTVDPEIHEFNIEADMPIDSGIDFYATQTLETEDGRRVMLGWMQNWDTISYTEDYIPWFGQMTMPRELFLKDNRLYQRPIRELETLRKNYVSYEDVTVTDNTVLEGVSGRVVDMTVEIEPGEELFNRFEIRFADNGEQYTSIIYRPYEDTLEFDRSRCGTRKGTMHSRKCRVRNQGGKLKLRIILDRFSCEIFINDGVQCMSNILYTPLSADGMRFLSDKKASITVGKYDLSRE